MFGIPGLLYIPNYIAPAEEQQLKIHIDSAPWDTTLKRRTQHYGWKYDYRARAIDPTMKIGPLPPFLSTLVHQLRNDGLAHGTLLDQAIVNEYQPGQGIAKHIDCQPCFGSPIISLSLGHAIPIIFRPAFPKSSASPFTLWLEPRSLLVLSFDARHQWTHEIAPRKSDDHPQHGIVPRRRRISITFRKVILP